MTSTWKRDGEGWKICHMSANSICFKTKDLSFIFVNGGGKGGSQNS